MANYTKTITNKDGHVLTLYYETSRDGNLEIGDTIKFQGSIYNSGGNGEGTFTEFAIKFNTSSAVHLGNPWEKVAVSINAPVKKTTTFAPVYITIDGYDCHGNSVIGDIEHVYWFFEFESPSTSQVATISDKSYFTINDTTSAPVYSLKPNDITDVMGYHDRFGAFVQNNSDVRLDILVADIDTETNLSQAGSAGVSKVSVKDPHGNEITPKRINQTGHFVYSIGKLEVFGEYTCELSLKGRYGKTSTSSTTFTVLPYTVPKLFMNGTNPIAKRFRAEQDDAGGTIYAEAPDGTIALLSFAGGIQAFGGLNTYDISVGYGIEGEGTIITHFASGTDADSIVFAYQDTIELLKNVTFSADNRYQFDITIKDYFNRSATITGYVDKAIFRFRVAENGVAVGMNTTGTAEHKKFEVAETYESHFYGGIAGVTNYPAAGVEELTGGTWIDGKPIYRQVLQYNLTSTGSTQNGPTIADFDELVSIKGRFYRSADGYYHQLNFYASSSDMNYAYMRSDGVLRVRSTDKAIVTAIVEYTKK